MAKKTQEYAPAPAESQAEADEALAIRQDDHTGGPDQATVAKDAGLDALQAESIPELRDVNEIIRERGLPAWKGAALCRHARWAPGKCVSAEEFEVALAGLENRPMGGGR